MKKKQVWRYYCEFCYKSSGTEKAMKKHELHCTMNPNRLCRMCKLKGGTQISISRLVALLPKYKVSTNTEDNGLSKNYCKALEEAMIKLRRETQNCPACILAALRQAGIPMILVEFDYKQEVENLFQKLDQVTYQ